MALTEDVKKSIIKALDTSSLEESFTEMVLNRLDSFGYEVKASDSLMIGFAMQKVENTIKNECNISEIPDGLIHTAVDMACGEFLFVKKQTGQLELGDLDLTGAVSSIKEGDTQVNFSSDESDSDKVDSFLNYLMNSGKGELVCYRKIRW
jgi:DNA helicase TIP49 (TBP-interacting protein)